VIIRTAANEQEIEQSIETYWANEPPHDAADKASALDHWLAMYAGDPEGFWIAVDEMTGQVVGVATALRRPPQWILANFYVLPAYHGQGIGRALLTRAVATHEGCDRFAVYASLHPSAQSLYMQFGMFPQPYSIRFMGSLENNLDLPSHLAAEKQPVAEILSSLNAFDRDALGFVRPVEHQRWGKDADYYLVKTKNHPVGYFRVAPDRLIGPLVVSDARWMTPTLELAIRKQWEYSPGNQEFFVPGANTAAVAYLLAHDYRVVELHHLLSSHPIPGLAKAVFHDTDFL